MTESEKLALEALIDKHGITQVLEVIADICGEKAQHIAENWDDDPLAERWETIASQLGAVDDL